MKYVLVSWLAGTALAAGVEDTVAQKDGWANYATELNRVTTKVNDTCGSTIASNYNKASYPTFDPIQDRTQAACQAAVSTLSALCTTDAGKTSVKALKTATCRFSTDGTKVTRDGTKLVVHVDPVKTSIVGAEAGSYSWASALREIL